MYKQGEMHKCEQCEFTFSSATYLKRHLVVHSGERPYECNHCGSTFVWKSNLGTHLKTHKAEKIEKCNECGGLLPNKSEYECEKCEEVFCSDCTVIRCVGRSIYHRVICKSCDG